MFVLIQAAHNHPSPSPTVFSFLLVPSSLLLLFYVCCFTTTITTIITTTTITVSQLLLIPLCKQVFISGAVELTTQLSKPVRILCVPKCRINKLGYLAREDYLDPLQLRVITPSPVPTDPRGRATTTTMVPAGKQPCGSTIHGRRSGIPAPRHRHPPPHDTSTPAGRVESVVH